MVVASEEYQRIAVPAIRAGLGQRPVRVAGAGFAGSRADDGHRAGYDHGAGRDDDDDPMHVSLSFR